MRSTQEWLYRPRDVDLRLCASLHPQVFCWSVGLDYEDFLTVVRLALCKGVVISNRFGVRCSGLETVRDFTVRDSALGN